jgi:hypothetical protein
MWPYRPISEQALKERREEVGGKKDRDTGYLKRNPNSQFPQEFRQSPVMIVSGTLKMRRMNGPVATSYTVFMGV